MRAGILAVLFNLVPSAFRTMPDPKQKLKKYLLNELMNTIIYDSHFNYHKVKLILILIVECTIGCSFYNLIC